MGSKRKTVATPARVALLGLGLMGGSLGLALRRAWPGCAIVGYDPAPGVAELARERGAITATAASVVASLSGAYLIIIAAPTLAARELLRAIGAVWETLAPGATVTDICSVKLPLMDWAQEYLPNPARFVGGHPMCGSELTGIEAARTGLYTDAQWIITAGPEAAPDAIAQVATLAAAAGARPIVMDAARHDHAVAGASHLPLIAAAMLAQTLAAQPDWGAIADLAASGYRDTTRIAAGDPHMGRDILLANSHNITPLLRAYIAALERLATDIEANDGSAIEATLQAASAARRAWPARKAP
jgi:prephenate dehydrogenase